MSAQVIPGLTLSANTETTLTFTPFNVGNDTGMWKARCSTAAGDTNPLNDTLSKRFLVILETGIEETMNDERGTPNLGPSIVRGVLRIGDSRQNTGYRAELLDAGGRKVMELRRGPNDVRHLSSGVYFVKAEGAAAKFIVQK